MVSQIKWQAIQAMHVGTAANGKVALWQANGKDGEFSELPMRRLNRNATGVWSANEKAWKH